MAVSPARCLFPLECLPERCAVIKVICLQSGSSGNCLYVEARDLALVVDAGIPLSQAQERLAERGADLSRVEALLVSHEHTDHSRYCATFQRALGVPLFATRGTMEQLLSRGLASPANVRLFCPGETLDLGCVRVRTVATPHDGTEGVAFVLQAGSTCLGILTDLGHVFPRLVSLMGLLDAVILESNYDPAMLASGPYPAPLKARIAGPGGHLSNFESADLVRRAASSRLQWACLAHLSAHNNTPQVALDTWRNRLDRPLALHVASRDTPCGPFTLP